LNSGAAMHLMGFMASLALPNCLIVTGITFNTNILHFTTRLSNLKVKDHPPTPSKYIGYSLGEVWIYNKL
jgi:hypothetical protein